MEYRNIAKVEDNLLKRTIDDTQRQQRKETMDYLQKLCVDRYFERQKSFWNRDYSSEKNFLKSVEANRRRWLEALGDFPCKSDFEVEEEPFYEDEKSTAKWIHCKFDENLVCRAVLGTPKNADKPFPLVICQHGASSSPENTFGRMETQYHAFAKRLLHDGYAILSPLCVTATDDSFRNKTERLSLLLGKTIFGLEIAKLKKLLDYVCALKEIDAKRIAMWGISMGGQYTLFTLPVEARIKVGIICAFFNHRRTKMAVEDPRYSCFLPLPEGEHVYIPGWLREFSDCDLLSLFAPRAAQIQAGKGDNIAWWPWLMEEFNMARQHYEKLNIPERLELDLHTGGHEIRYEQGLRFLKKWLI